MPPSCLRTLAESDAPSDCLTLHIRENAPMSSNRDDFREVAYSNQLRVTIRSFLGETQYTLGVLVVEMRHHSRCRQMGHAGASPSKISRPCTLRYKSTRISMPKLLYHLNKAAQLPTFDFSGDIFAHSAICARRGVFQPPKPANSRSVLIFATIMT